MPRFKALLALSPLVAAAVVAPAAHAQPAARAGCSQAAQRSGDCVGFAAYAGQNRYLAAVTGQLRMGRVATAKHFAAAISDKLGATASTLLRSSSATNASDTADRLQAMNEPAAPATTVPPQAKNGATAAVGYYHWTLHNTYTNIVYYGDCNPGGCEQLGSDNVTETANIFDSATTGAQWHNYITHHSGKTANLANFGVRLYRDITNAADTDEVKLSCAASGSSSDCTAATKAGGYKGHWYYFRIDFDFQVSGYAETAYQEQTRRYLNEGPYTWSFESYRYYGN